MYIPSYIENYSKFEYDTFHFAITDCIFKCQESEIGD